MLKLTLLTVSIIFAAGGAVQAQSTTPTPLPTVTSNSGTNMVGVPGCHFGERIDGSTADDASAHLRSAGYTNVTGLKKSCDNNWHGHATLNGVGTNVMVTPDGQVIQEGY
jgi:hypothetical protein